MDLEYTGFGGKWRGKLGMEAGRQGPLSLRERGRLGRKEEKYPCHPPQTHTGPMQVGCVELRRESRLEAPIQGSPGYSGGRWVQMSEPRAHVPGAGSPV